MNATHQTLALIWPNCASVTMELPLQAASTSLSARRSRRCPQIPHRPGTSRFRPLIRVLNFVIDKADNIRNKFVAVVERFHRQIVLCEKLVKRFPQCGVDLGAPCSEHGIDGIDFLHPVFLCDIITASFGPSLSILLRTFSARRRALQGLFRSTEVDSRNMTLSTIDFLMLPITLCVRCVTQLLVSRRLSTRQHSCRIA